jgi:hypothetical protein
MYRRAPLQQHGSKRIADKVLWNMIFSLKYILFAGAPFYKFVRNRKERVEKVREFTPTRSC